jgi:tRNA-specific 2-thiouridylase
VIDIRPEQREVVVGTAEELEGRTVRLEEVNWLGEPLGVGDTCAVQVRYRSRAVPARVTASNGSDLELTLEQPARAITPGQSGVLYVEERVAGGGVIH